MKHNIEISILENKKYNLKKRKKEYIQGSVLLLPAILILLFTSLVPLLFAFGVSFTDWNLASKPEPSFSGIGNYVNAFKDFNFRNSILITLIFVFVTVFFEALIGMILALLYSREGKRFRLARTLLIIPMVSTPVVIGILWRIMLNTDYGVVNYFLSLVGISKIHWLGDPFWAFISIMIVDVWQWTPFMIIVFVAALLSVPKDVVNASKIDGATAWQILWKIRLPIIKPIIFIGILLRFIDAFKVVDTVFVMTYGGPGDATRVLSMFIYQEALKYFKVGYGSAISIIFILIMLTISFFFVRKHLKGLGEN